MRVGVPVAVTEPGAITGESPVWDGERQELLWVDIQRGLVHILEIASGRRSVLETGQLLGAVALTDRGGLLLARNTGFAIADRSDGSMFTLAELDDEPAGHRMNDGKCDSRGRLWAGTMGIERLDTEASLYRLDARSGTAEVTRILDGISISNGIDWSPDDSRMYFADTPTGRVDVFDYEAASGEISNRRVFVEVDEGLPDGLTVDARGYVWVALVGAGQIRRYGPEGERELTIRFPVSKVTSCCFGGERLTDLYVTSATNRLSRDQLRQQPLAGAVFRCTTGVVGRLPNRVAIPPNLVSGRRRYSPVPRRPSARGRRAGISTPMPSGPPAP